jgi:3-phenylpropionate/cinnamic acid dioxygenase small subunit
MRPEDRLEIHELLARYGFILDDRDWQSFDAVFTEDGVCDLTAWQVPMMRGIAAIRATYAEIAHPVAHLTMNTVIEAVSDERARVRSKILAVRPDRRVETAEYHDELARTAGGWRIAKRVVVPRLATDSWDALGAGETSGHDGD